MQHSRYIAAIEEAGWSVLNLPEEPHLPDSVFVEDTAIILSELAVMTRPGAETRRPEVNSIRHALANYMPTKDISDSAILDGGDVLVAGKHIFVGLSSRSDANGAAELAAIAKPLGYSLETIAVKACLHLKSAVTSVGDHTLLYNPKWVRADAFEGFSMIPVHPNEPSAGNCVDLDGVLLHGEAFPKTRAVLEDAGFSVAAAPMDELAKAEGAATCCSLLLQST